MGSEDEVVERERDTKDQKTAAQMAGFIAQGCFKGQGDF